VHKKWLHYCIKLRREIAQRILTSLFEPEKMKPETQTLIFRRNAIMERKKIVGFVALGEVSTPNE